MDQSPFADPLFDAHRYAHDVLTANAAAHVDSAATGDNVSLAIGELSSGIDSVSLQIRGLINDNYDALLRRTASANHLSNSLTTVKAGLSELDVSLDKLRQKIRSPYQALSQGILRLQRLQLAADALRRSSRFILLARRLQYQMSQIAPPSAENVAEVPAPFTSASLEDAGRESAISKAALTIAELELLLKEDSQFESETVPNAPIPLRHIKVVQFQMETIDASRRQVTSEIEALIASGLSELNQVRIASALQTAHNLDELPRLVRSLLNDIAESMQSRIKQSFDVSRISKELAKDAPTSNILYKSRVRTEPSYLTAPQWTNTLWTGLETLIDELASSCIQVYTLEKVLRLKRDMSNQMTFLDESLEQLDNKPSSIFWSALARSLEKQCREAVKGSTFLQQTLSQGYPRFLRLFHDFFAKIAVHADISYTQTNQSAESILTMRALSPFEALYLSRSTSKLNEVVAQSLSGGTRSPPSMGEGLAIARTISNELDSARFDPLLLQSVAKNAGSVVDLFLNRMETLVIKDRNATSFFGSVAPPQQVLNAHLASTLYHCHARLSKVIDEYPNGILSSFSASLGKILSAFQQIVDPILSSIRRELGSIISRMHRLDFSKPDTKGSMGGASLYMKDLSERIGFIRSEVLSLFQVGELHQTWLLAVARFVIKTFALHLSIVKPLGENGKLQLTSDMTELEFSLNAFLADNTRSKINLKLADLGDDFKMLRAIRPMLFLDKAGLTEPSKTADIPPLIILHHLLVRSPLPLPHALHGWQEAEYVAWLEEHSTEDALSLVRGDLDHWEKLKDGEQADEGREYVELCRRVLSST